MSTDPNCYAQHTQKPKAYHYNGWLWVLFSVDTGQYNMAGIILKGAGRTVENEIVLKVEGLELDGAKEKIQRCIEKMPGIEYLNVDEDAGTVTIIGGDIDRLTLEDEIEAMGYRVIS